MAMAALSAQGRLVIPREIRERYGLSKGDMVHILDVGGRIVPIPVAEDPIGAGRAASRRGYAPLSYPLGRWKAPPNLLRCRLLFGSELAHRFHEIGEIADSHARGHALNRQAQMEGERGPEVIKK